MAQKTRLEKQQEKLEELKAKGASKEEIKAQEEIVAYTKRKGEKYFNSEEYLNI